MSGKNKAAVRARNDADLAHDIRIYYYIALDAGQIKAIANKNAF